METAADEKKFEIAAAALRDRVQALNTVRERQKIISTRTRTRTSSASCARAQTRACSSSSSGSGRLLGRESFFFERLAGASDGEILSAFLRQFYAREVVPPPEILLSETPPEATSPGSGSPPRRGGRVELLAPQRGRKRELVAMAEENAALALQTHLLARGNRTAGRARRAPALARLARAAASHRGFDISTHQGGETVASMVVWQDGDMKKDDYKRYQIRTVIGHRRLRGHAGGGEPALRPGAREPRACFPT